MLPEGPTVPLHGSLAAWACGMPVSEATDNSLQGTLLIWNILELSFFSCGFLFGCRGVPVFGTSGNLDIGQGTLPCQSPHVMSGAHEWWPGHQTLWLHGQDRGKSEVRVNEPQKGKSEAETVAGLWGERQKSFCKERKGGTPQMEKDKECFLGHLGWCQRKMSVWRRCQW